MEFKDSKTKENLMRAFAGESQARNRYTFAAEQAKKAKLQAVSFVFTYTADQEKAHAKVFYDHLRELSGETIFIDGGYPVDITEDVADLLRRAEHNEHEEAEDVYPEFARIAEEEGFARVAASFRMIAGIERVHEQRFRRFAQWLEEQKLFAEDSQRAWICLNCGFIYEGEQVPLKCPVCEHDQGYFVRLELSPYADDKTIRIRNGES